MNIKLTHKPRHDNLVPNVLSKREEFFIFKLLISEGSYKMEQKFLDKVYKIIK